MIEKENLYIKILEIIGIYLTTFLFIKTLLDIIQILCDFFLLHYYLIKDYKLIFYYSCYSNY